MRAALHLSAHLQQEQYQREKFSYGLDWQQKCIWYCLEKLDNNMFQSVRGIRWNHKLHQENYENMESGIDSRKECLAEAKIQRGKFPVDALSTLIFVIEMMPLNRVLRKCTAWYKVSKSQEKISHLLDMGNIKLTLLWKKHLGSKIKILIMIIIEWSKLPQRDYNIMYDCVK